MDRDTYRNSFFSLAIRRHSSQPEKRARRVRDGRNSRSITIPPVADKAVERWLEIGPGAIGTLTRMILADPAAQVVAIEANPGAARTLCRRPDIRPYILNGRLRVSI